MKSKIFMLVLLMSVLMISCNQKNQQEKTTDQNPVSITKNENLKLQVYYFYSAHRCPTCNSIENNVKKVMETQFSNEIKEGLVNVSYVNIEDKENKALVEKLQVYGSSLFLVQYKGDQEVIHDLTEYAYTYSRKQPDIFIQGISDTIKSYLN